MNERIEQLADQCMTERQDSNGVYVEYFDHKKFAELIIEECIEQCNKKDPRPDRYSDWEEFAESRKVRECITSIKKHFGVE